MKFFYLILIILQGTELFSQSRKSPFALVEIESVSSSKTIRNCSIKVKYPVLVKKFGVELESSILNKINKLLKKEFQDIKRYDNEFECNRNASKSDPSFHLEVKFDVKHNEGNLISIHYAAVGYLSGAAHPNNVYKGFTFDLRTGDQIDFDEIFLQGTNYLLVLNTKILEELLKLGVISSEEEFEEIKKNRYDFYISKNVLYIINIYEIHAMQSLEVGIPFKKIGKVIQREKLYL
ncbi:MAG: DUF4163 domain-containing protein [Leptospiraceae bacterium]|nr:DUF4163 domain-containing protein [Leptospiraceae bacterium]